MAVLELLVEELRKKYKFTLTELAKKSGVSKSTLSEIKSRQKTTLNKVQEIGLAKAFGVDVKELYKEELK